MIFFVSNLAVLQYGFGLTQKSHSNPLQARSARYDGTYSELPEAIMDSLLGRILAKYLMILRSSGVDS
ncbi:MAG: hypothetical protein KDD64_07180 [Bdellovibrionales bacterium]|nr:hypothetical protein [Bdellovibrionales bacterium]